MDNQIELNRVLQSSGADGALLINKDGKLLDALNIDYDGNIAAMTNVVRKMINELAEDLGHEEVVQITCKSEDGIYIIHKISDDAIVCIDCKDLSKIGYLMLALKAIKI